MESKLNQEEKKKLLELTPEKYIGNAVEMAMNIKKYCN